MPNLRNQSLSEINATEYALLASPALTGTPTAPTANTFTNTTQIATTAYVVETLAEYTPIIDSLSDIGNTTIDLTPTNGDFLKWNGSAWVNDPIDLGTDTTGNYIATITGTANEISVSGSGSENSAVTISLPANVTISNNLVVTGDLTVSGNTTTLNTANLNVEDNFIMLNSGETGSPTLNAGIEVERGTSTNVLISWNETTDKWQFTNDGSTYDNIAGTASPTFTGTVTGSPAAGTTATGTSGFGYMGLPQNSATTGAYGVVAADAGTHIYSTATRTVTIPANGTIAMPIGTTLVFIAGTGATVTISITSDTLILAGLGTTAGSRTLAPFGMATAVKIASTTWIISGNGLT